jgi:hypothetical protein
MSTFDQRQDAFEKKFALDEEQKFKATARRNRKLGAWVAELTGLSGAEAEAYAKSVVAADFEEAGDDDVFRKVRADLNAKGKQSISDADIREKMSALLSEAAAEIKAGK